jgi:hypothetical protein
MAGTTDLDGDTTHEWRVATIEELGFTATQAEFLALTTYFVYPRGTNGQRRRYEVRVDHHYLRKLLDAGATHDQVLLIVL